MAPDDSPRRDPWRSFSYLVAGVAFYGAVGWGLDRWLGTDFLVAVGIIAGAALGIYLTWAALRGDVGTGEDDPGSDRDPKT
jgi:ATP synthase protein I